MLLGDLKVIFDRRRVEQLHSDDIIDDLVEMEERPWAEWRNGKPITKNQLAKLLAGFEVHPKQVWSNSKNKGGYKLETLKPAFTRYLSPRVLDPLAGNELRGFKVLDPDSDPRTLKTLDPLKSKDSRTLGLQEPEVSDGDPFESLKDPSLKLPPKDEWPELPPALDRRRRLP